ncbi:ABC transporter ATP-binding protein [Salaquimonas pukyongi]|uniref:ABC transporter ATP-binding protein n=1 Tax=Salaquimonas pukyongi TaxID=2712698 RepID=UPI00096BA58F|nr:ABC transporter ATP-binding protein [Salaquimonas pukyongi]
MFDRIFSWFENRFDPFAPHAGAPPHGLVAFSWHFVRQFRWAFLFMLVFGFANAAVEAAIFTFVGELVDILTVFEARHGSGVGKGWGALLAAAGPTLALMAAVTLGARVIIVAIGALIEEQLVVPNFFTAVRWQSHTHVVQQSLGFFQNDLAGRIAQKVFQTGHAMGDMMVALVQTIGFIAAYAFTTFGLLLALHVELGISVLVWLVAFLLLARFFVPRIREHGRKTAEAAALATGRMVDGYSNISTVKLYGSTSGENDWVKEGLKGQYDALRLFTRDLTGVRISLSVISNIAVCFIAWQAVDLWLGGKITLGEVAFSTALVLRLTLLLNRLMGILNGFFRNVGVTQNSMELIAQQPQIRDLPDADELEPGGGKIEFDNIVFHYGKGEGLFDGFSLIVQPGEKLGIAGPSGGGKSTLINLMLRFFELEKGVIRINEQDIRSVTQDSLRAAFSLVQQDPAMFHRSVRENIAYGKPQAGLDEIIEAARQANAHEFITGLKDSRGRTGYDAHVGERGVQLSGGQRQRIAIARVFLRDAPILILDEATSQLDSGVEAAIRENLDTMMKGKTVIAIAHRLSTLAEMDRLVIVDKGKITEVGTHRELLEREGLYANLWARQAGGFLPLEA